MRYGENKEPEDVFIRNFVRMLNDRSGAALVEYALTLALLSSVFVWGFVAVYRVMVSVFIASTGALSAPAFGVTGNLP